MAEDMVSWVKQLNIFLYFRKKRNEIITASKDKVFISLLNMWFMLQNHN